MSADTFVSALLIITGVVAAGILINAVYPVIWSSASTFSSSAHETDTRMRTDFKIVNTYAKADSNNAQIFIKNVGSTSLGSSEIQSADVYIVTSDKLVNPAYGATAPSWTCLLKSSDNTNWDNGETLEIDITLGASDGNFVAGTTYMFEFVLPNGVQRSIEFTPSS